MWTLGFAHAAEQILDAAERSDNSGGLVRHVDNFVVFAGSHGLQRLQVADGNEVLRGIALGAAEAFGDQRDGVVTVKIDKIVTLLKFAQ